MDEDRDYIELVKQAQLGDRESLDSLAGLVRERLYAYVYRIVLREDLAQDIVQESMLEMFKVLGKLERADRFWPWLRGIAFNKMRHHYTKEQHRRMVSMPGAGDRDYPQGEQKDGEAGLANLVSEELKQIVFTAMQELNPRHRKVLTMRCYEGMEYSEIAELMGGSELSVRVLFYRAKRALGKRLSRKGLGKGFLLTALVLFGKMTAPSEAAAVEVSVTAATAKVGIAAGLVAVAASKATIVSVTTAGVLAVGTMVATSGPDKTMAGAGEKPVIKNLQVTRPVWQVSEAAGEYWYFFPEGAEGPVMMQQIKRTGRQWLQDEQANYRNRKNTIFIENCRMWRSDLAVWRLPTDSPELTDFLCEVEGKSVDMEYVPNRGSGLLVMAEHSGNDGGSCSWITRYHTVLDEDYFQCDWPMGARVVDERDAMHRRGWTYFRAAGEINGEKVTGAGRIPFVYAASKRHWPWMKVRIGQKVFIDESFTGLSRPWMGLHTIDTVRRDAAEQRIWFEMKYRRGSGKAEVVLTYEQSEIIYTIDMDKDVIDKIIFSGDTEGELEFSYLQEIGNPGREFAEPKRMGISHKGTKARSFLDRIIEER